MTLEINNLHSWQICKVKDLDQADRYLHKPADILNLHRCNWYLGFGTALGLWRDGDLIPTDQDVDFCILVDSLDQPNRLITSFSEKWKLIRTVLYKACYMQAAFQAPDNFIIDLAFFYPEKDYYFTEHEGGAFIDKADVLGNLDLKITKYGFFPTPDKMDEYLTARYGDWRTPRPGALSCSRKDKRQ